MDPLLSNAALVRVDVYDAGSAHCDGTLLAPGAGPALLSKSFTQGEPIQLSLSGGMRIVVVSTFGDAQGTIITGSSCDAVSLGGGKSSCLSISLTSIDGGIGCTPTDDQCPMGQYCAGSLCASGCKNDGECTPQFCDPTRHQCVECLIDDNCPVGKMCSASGRCAEGCDDTHPCAGGLSCCDMFCIDTHTDPFNCGGCGMACMGGDTLCCNSTCANPSTSTDHCGMCGNACSTLNGTPVCSGGTCDWTCAAGFKHCGTGNTGCDTDITGVDNCGGCGNVCTPNNATANRCTAGQCAYDCVSGYLDCLKVGANTDGCDGDSHAITSCGACGVSCDTVSSTGATCPGTTCLYGGCMPGHSDCDQSGTNANGCECPTSMCCGTMCQPAHMNGLGQTYYYMCVNPGTLSLGAAQAAAAAWDATATIATSTDCSPSGCVSALSATECAVWCYDKGLAGKVTKITSTTCTNVCPSGPNPVMTWN